MGVAVVIVNHMAEMPTQLHEVLPRFSRIPVALITEDLLTEPYRFHIIPANRDPHADGELFHPTAISKPRGWPDVITVFLQPLTQFWEGKLIAVIVSGHDGDGAAALCCVQEVGGITIAQKLATAIQPNMPQSAIACGCFDFFLSPEDIARQIARIARDEAPASAAERAVQRRMAATAVSGAASKPLRSV